MHGVDIVCFFFVPQTFNKAKFKALNLIYIGLFLLMQYQFRLFDNVEKNMYSSYMRILGTWFSVYFSCSKYTKEQLSLNTDCRRDRHTNEIDNYALNSDYQQRDNVDDVQEKPKPYDQLQVRLNHGNIDNEQTNTPFSRVEYSKYESIIESNGIHTNTVILEYEDLHKADKDTSTQSYDQLNVTRIVQSEPTSIFSKNKLSREKYSKIEMTNSTAVTSEYAQLDNAEKDKSPNVYDQLHVTDDTIGNKQTNYNSKTMILRDQQSKNEQTEETTVLNNMTVASEYEQWDSAKKDKSVNVYDQLDVANVISNNPTHHNTCQ